MLFFSKDNRFQLSTSCVLAALKYFFITNFFLILETKKTGGVRFTCRSKKQCKVTSESVLSLWKNLFLYVFTQLKTHLYGRLPGYVTCLAVNLKQYWLHAGVLLLRDCRQVDPLLSKNRRTWSAAEHCRRLLGQ